MDRPRLEMNGDALIERCQAGDAEAFEALFELHGDRVFNIAYGLLGDRAAAVDLTQEVFVKLLTRIRQFRFDSAFETWLYRIVVNAFYDQRRAPRWEPLTAPLLRRMTVAPSQQAQLERKELEREVRKAVASLRPKLRVPVVLRYLSGLSYEEVAAALNVSAGTVASRLNRAHLKLAEKMKHLR
jgi:RNA polymerase sigma-70 factor, ECF subfamily